MQRRSDRTSCVFKILHCAYFLFRFMWQRCHMTNFSAIYPHYWTAFDCPPWFPCPSLQGLLSTPPAWHESFLRSPLWPQSSRATSASGPAGRVNLPALIKIASFVAFSLSLSSCPWRWELPAAVLTQKDKPLEKTKVCSTIFWMSLQKKYKPHLILLLVRRDRLLWMNRKSPWTWAEDPKVYHGY